MAGLSAAIPNLGFPLSKNPGLILRLLLFVVALVVAFGRRGVRERVQRVTGKGWEKVRETVGMGVRVSYI